MEYFVRPGNVVREIWGKSDTILFIFAGASAEFALNKAVDWLYFTGRLPADPIGRLFSTVRYAREIVFSPRDAALKAIHKITSIHQGVENKRGSVIPMWAYRDVLFMLIYYSIAAYELLEKKLSDPQKEEVYQVFYEMGINMGIEDLPATYKAWLPVREAHLQADLAVSDHSIDLFKQYRKHLGAARYAILIEGQKLVVPKRVGELLQFSSIHWMAPVVPIFKFSRLIHMDKLIKAAILPFKYKDDFKALEENLHEPVK
ncbi:oxygenase MpaB family protein [Aridibaculum aurantiacum]|uniref:oxygenase MpaB family protein n=1 Tax=Aridibaculum aurantiacum TaxID=2810307 RepID=UPI001A9604A7|nr:oxygenase MpaB family protein [Aridibaculum aurantiacum]